MYDEILKYLEKNNISSTKKDFNNEKISYEDYKELQFKIDSITSNKKDNRNSNLKNKTNFFVVKNFLDNLRQDFIKQYYSYQEYNRPYLSISELLQCLRKSYYFRMKFKPDESYLYKNIDSMISLMYGNFIHDIISKYYPFTFTEKTFKLEKFGKVKGKVDGIKNNLVFEIKTDTRLNFDYAYKQACCYAYMYNVFEDKKIVDNIIIIHVTSVKPFKYDEYAKKLDESLAESNLNRGYILREALDTKQIPNKEKSNLCYYCEFSKYCNKDIEITSYENIEDNNTNTSNKIKDITDITVLL